MKKTLSNLKENWKSGLTVSLVSIPLSLALAIASGATPAQGMITALWAGIFAAIFGGSNFNIVGPTGALSGVLIGYTIIYGYAGLPLIALVTGLMTIVAYLLRLDRYIIFIPGSVVHGFTLGVAFIIGLGQINNIFGLHNMPKAEGTINGLALALERFADIQWPIFAVFVLGVAFIFYWNKKVKKIPGAVVLAFIGIISSLYLANHPLSFLSFETLGQKYDIKAQFFINTWQNFSWSMLYNKEVWIISLATTIIAILETLMSGQIADNMTKTKFNRKKEVLGLGIANIASGLTGGIPATAALARTTLNVKSGATHKSSALMSGVFLFIISFALLGYFKALPMVIIASILVYVAISMVEMEHFIKLLGNEKTAFWLSIIVAIVTITEDPIIGLLVGSIIALLIFVQNISQGKTEILIFKNGKMTESLMRNDINGQELDSDMVVYKISGALTYINMPAHLKIANKIKGNKYVILSLRHAFYVDTDGINYLKEIIEILKNQNEKIIITGINPEIKERIEKEEFYKTKLAEDKIYDRTSEAINKLYKQN
jgi:SulP family sulfate permease